MTVLDLLTSGSRPGFDDSPTDTGGGTDTLFSSEGWRGAVTDAFGVDIVEFVPESQPDGRAYYSLVSDVRGDRVICTPFSDVCDPMLSEAGWGEFADHLRSFDAPVTVRPFTHQPSVTDTSFERRTELLWHGIDLTDGFDAVWDGLKTKLRTSIRRAPKEGLTFRVSSDREDLARFHQLHVDLRKSKYRLLAQPFEFFANLQDSFGDDLVVLLAEDTDGEAVAGMVFLAWDGVWYYKFSASVATPRKYRPNAALLMEACRVGAERGLHLMDLGRSDADQPGLVQFKQQFASEERELSTLHWHPAGHGDLRADATGRLLGELTELLTDPGVPDEVTARAGATLYRFFA